MNISERYQIAPQMEAYDELPTVVLPYLTIGQKPNTRSDVVNTDKHGFRYSYKGEGLIDSQSWWSQKRRGILLGGSFAFGVGATNDKQTVASVIGTMTDWACLNLGIRAGNSLQELISILPFVEDSQIIVVCSGMNNLVTAYQSTGRNDLYGSLFFEELVEVLEEWPIGDLIGTIRPLPRHERFYLQLRRLLRKGTIGKRNTASPKGVGDLQGETGEDPIGKALEMQHRDLAAVAKLKPAGCRLIFVAQPFAETGWNGLSPEESRMFDLTDQMQPPTWNRLKNFLTTNWSSYVNSLSDLCNSEGVQFLDLNCEPFVGWSFVDRVHMTDLGYAQVAERIAEVIV